MIDIFYNPHILDYSGRFPEGVDSINSIVSYLRNSDLGYTLNNPKLFSESDLLLAHDERYIKEIREFKRINSFFPDYNFNENTYSSLLWSASSAISAAFNSLKSDNKFSLALTFPHGNQAGYNYLNLGSIINHMVVAVNKLLLNSPMNRLVVFDFDAQFCKGTVDLFRNNKNVYVFSLHQKANTLHPKGGHSYNSTSNMFFYEYPLFVSDEEYLNQFNAIFDKIGEISPDMIAYSCGFNIYHEDIAMGTSSLIKSLNTFRKMGENVTRLNRDLGISSFGILEGGYTNKMGELVYHFLKGISL